jgi:hypothetical protein
MAMALLTFFLPYKIHKIFFIHLFVIFTLTATQDIREQCRICGILVKGFMEVNIFLNFHPANRHNLGPRQNCKFALWWRKYGLGREEVGKISGKVWMGWIKI